MLAFRPPPPHSSGRFGLRAIGIGGGATRCRWVLASHCEVSYGQVGGSVTDSLCSG